MDSKKQKLLIEYLISSTDTFALCQNIVQPEYFNPEYRNAVTFIKQYFDQYNSTPTPEQIEAETDVTIQQKQVAPDEIEYTANEIENFCRRSALQKAILESPDLIEKGDYATVEQNVRDAIMVSLNRDLGLRYFEQVEDRLNRMLNSDNTEPTGWDDVDDLLFGGLSRKELALLAANSGGGKSITLANLAFNFLERGHNVLYISLELSEDIIGQRFDTMFTGISRRDWQDHINELATQVKAASEGRGNLDIVQMAAGSCANDFRAFLKEYYLHYQTQPDLLVVDYLDEMSPNEKVSADNKHLHDHLCTRELRQIMVDHDMFGASASQLNREAVKATEHDHSHIAGGISKINVVDVYWTIMMTPTMMASGDVAFNFQKTRNSEGAGNTVWLKWDPKYLRIRNRTSDEGINFKSRSEVEQQVQKQKDSFLVDHNDDNVETSSGNGLESLLENYN